MADKHRNVSDELQTDIRVIKFCLDCKEEKCTGNKCTKLISYEKGLKNGR
nr:MAG TPA: hypothetical protein [Caudoviricetes sp.]